MRSAELGPLSTGDPPHVLPSVTYCSGLALSDLHVGLTPALTSSGVLHYPLLVLQINSFFKICN